MRRKRLIIASALAALVGVAAPLALAMHLAKERAMQGEQERLRFLASYALERAQRTLVSAGDALRSFAPLDVAPCSPAHIERLRRTTITTRSVDDIGCVIADMRDALAADRDLHIAINLCASDIETGRVLQVLDRVLAGSGIAPQQIWLEATERGFINAEAARVTLALVRERGYAVAIDDFGTGYSSLASLQSLPLDALKIDKAFVDTIALDAATSSVTPHIIAMARGLKLQIVAEGIETRAQADYLTAQQVEYGQGWLFAKALPAADFLAFYRARQLHA